MTTFNLFPKLSKFIPSGDLLSDCKIYVLYLISLMVHRNKRLTINLSIEVIAISVDLRRTLCQKSKDKQLN